MAGHYAIDRDGDQDRDRAQYEAPQIVERAAKTELAGPPQSFGISAVARLRTPEQAQAEVARLS